MTSDIPDTVRSAAVEAPTTPDSDEVDVQAWLDYGVEQPDTHCGTCHRPLPHNEAEQAACPSAIPESIDDCLDAWENDDTSTGETT